MPPHDQAFEEHADGHPLRSATDEKVPSVEERPVLAFVSEQSAVTVSQLVRFFGVDRSDMEGFLCDFEAAGWLEHKEVITSQDVWVWLTHRGDVLSGTGFRKHSPLNFGRLAHYHAITEARLRITKQRPKSKWICERRLWSKRHRVQRTLNIPDAIFEAENDDGVLERWAIEAELSPKKPERLRKIIAEHSRRFDVVVYLCSPQVWGLMDRLGLEREFSNLKCVELFGSSRSLSASEVTDEEADEAEHRSATRASAQRVLGPWEVGLLALLAEQGAIPMDQLLRFLKGEKTVVKRRVARLLKDGFIRRSRPLAEEPDWFWLSKAGGDASRSGLSFLDPRVGGLDRVRAANEVRLHIEARLPTATVRWQSWRVLRHQNGPKGSFPRAVAEVGAGRHAIEIWLAERRKPEVRQLLEERAREYDSVTVFCSRLAYSGAKQEERALQLPNLTVELLPGQKFRKRKRQRPKRAPQRVVMAEIPVGDLPVPARAVLRKAHGSDRDPTILSVERRVTNGPPRYRVVTDDGVWQALLSRRIWRVQELAARYEEGEECLALGQYTFGEFREGHHSHSSQPKRSESKEYVEEPEGQFALVGDSPRKAEGLAEDEGDEAFGERRSSAEEDAPSSSASDSGASQLQSSVDVRQLVLSDVAIGGDSPSRPSRHPGRMMVEGDGNAALAMAELAVEDLPDEARAALFTEHDGSGEPKVLVVERRFGRGRQSYRVVTDAGVWRVTSSRYGWRAEPLENRYEPGEKRIPRAEVPGRWRSLKLGGGLVMVELFPEELPEEPRRALREAHGSSKELELSSVERRFGQGRQSYRVVTDAGVWWVSHTKKHGSTAIRLGRRFEPNEERFELSHPRAVKQRKAWSLPRESSPSVMVEVLPSALPAEGVAVLAEAHGGSLPPEVLTLERRAAAGPHLYRAVTGLGIWRVSQSKWGWRATRLENRFEPGEVSLALGEETKVESVNGRQRALLAHALESPDSTYSFQGHGKCHSVSTTTAQNDLGSLVDLGFLVRRNNQKRKALFSPVPDLAERLKVFEAEHGRSSEDGAVNT